MDTKWFRDRLAERGLSQRAAIAIPAPNFAGQPKPAKTFRPALPDEVTGSLMGDPEPGRSALDKRNI